MCPVPVELKIKDNWLEKSIIWSCKRTSFTIDRSLMNPRAISEKLDDIVMGEIATIAVMQFLSETKGYGVLAYDQIRTDNFQNPDPGWDVIVGDKSNITNWVNTVSDYYQPMPALVSLSIKSSRIPKADNDSIQVAISKRDFKIFKESNFIKDDLLCDYEVQVYYSLGKSQYYSSLGVSKEDVLKCNVQNIAQGLRIKERYGNCFLVGFGSREKIIQYSDSLRRRGVDPYWVSYHAGYEKPMWKAPLTLGVSPSLITFNDRG